MRPPAGERSDASGLTLVDSKTFDTGTLILTYHPVGDRQYQAGMGGEEGRSGEGLSMAAAARRARWAGPAPTASGRPPGRARTPAAG